MGVWKASIVIKFYCYHRVSSPFAVSPKLESIIPLVLCLQCGSHIISLSWSVSLPKDSPNIYIFIYIYDLFLSQLMGLIFFHIFFSCKWDTYNLISFGTGIKSALFYDAEAAFPCCLSSPTLYSCSDIAYPWGGNFWNAKCIAVLTFTGGSCS